MRSTAAARRYARAIFSLATEAGRVDEVGAELRSLRELVDESADLREVLLTPLHPVAQRKQVLDVLVQRAGLSPIVRQFTAFLIDQRRLLDFPTIEEEYTRQAEEASGRMKATVVSASPMDEGRCERLRRVLSERTGHEIDLEVREDPTLLGGAIATVGDLVFDGSLRTQLGQLRANLMRES